jgi:hypothetical protein
VAWFYRCEVEWTDLNDMLDKSFTVIIPSQTRLSQSFAALLVSNKAYMLIKEYKDTPPHPDASKEDYNIRLSDCEEEAET